MTSHPQAFVTASPPLFRQGLEAVAVRCGFALSTSEESCNVYMHNEELTVGSSVDADVFIDDRHLVVRVRLSTDARTREMVASLVADLLHDRDLADMP